MGNNKSYIYYSSVGMYLPEKKLITPLKSTKVVLVVPHPNDDVHDW